MTDSQTYWKHGQRTQLASLASISDAHLSDILHRRKGCSVTLGHKLEIASEEVLGVRIPWELWVCNKHSKHPAFIGEPLEDIDIPR